MNKTVRIQKPKFIEELEEVEDLYEEVEIKERIQNKIIENKIISNKTDVGFTIDSCIFKNVIFKDCDFTNIDLIDTRFEGCDLSNTSFRNGGIHRVEFINCKLLGSIFIECSIKDVLLQNILGEYSNFSFSKIKKINIIESNLQRVIFQEAKIENAVFINTSLLGGYFNKTFLGKIDLTTCEITGIDLDMDDLFGAVVTPIQALELTRLMGLVIK